VFRAVGTAMGLVSGLALAPHFADGLTAPGIPTAAAIAFAIGVVPWLIPAHRQWLASVLMVAAMGIIAPLGIWTIGPTLGMGALLVVVPLAATFLFGRRLAVPGAVYATVVLLGVGAASLLAGRPAVGVVPGTQVPYAVYLRISFTTLGCIAIVLVLTDALLGAVEKAIGEARAATARERGEQERRIAAERSLARAQRLEAIGQLASGVAHDTRNALLVMRSAVTELRVGHHLPAEDAEVLADLEHAVAAITDTMRQLLALSFRGDAEQPAAHPVAPGPIVEAFASAVRRVLPGEVKLQIETVSTAPVLLQSTLLEQALLNLALNARDAMPEGGALSLRVREERSETPARVVVEVSDTGVGMDPATAARMFEPFFTTKPQGQGTGLGLAMVQGFVAAAAGRIEVESVPGAGTCVRMSFPAAPSAP